jgi:hypothetical protein
MAECGIVEDENIGHDRLLAGARPADGELPAAKVALFDLTVLGDALKRTETT